MLVLAAGWTKDGEFLGTLQENVDEDIVLKGWENVEAELRNADGDTGKLLNDGSVSFPWVSKWLSETQESESPGVPIKAASTAKTLKMNEVPKPMQGKTYWPEPTELDALRSRQCEQETRNSLPLLMEKPNPTQYAKTLRDGR
jgi:hypothetical protein